MRLRAVSLVLFVATQAVAGGLTSAIHLCSQETMRDTCRCRHGQPVAPDLAAIGKHDCCESRAVTSQAIDPVTADLRAQPQQIATPVPLPIVFTQPTLPGPSHPLAWQVDAPSQGPPIFLKVQSLLN